MTETPFHLYDHDGSRYSLDVLLDRRDETNPHYDLDLVRMQVGRFGETLEQRLTLSEHPQQHDAHQHCQQLEDTLTEQGLTGLGDAGQRIKAEPVLYDGEYLLGVFPPDPDSHQEVETALQLLHLSQQGVRSAALAVGAETHIDQTHIHLEAQRINGGIEALLETAQAAAVEAGLCAPETPLFGAMDGEPLNPDFPFLLDAYHRPFDATGAGLPHHVDGGGTTHWFAVIERAEGDPFELRYFRALETAEGDLKHDSYPVMPLPDDDPASPWPLNDLERYLKEGDVYRAQQLAHDVADHYQQPFPAPFEIKALDAQPDYYFGYGTGPNHAPSLEAVKTWMDGAERRFDTFTIAEYASWEDAAPDEVALEAVLKSEGLEAAMNQAERMAVASGYLDPDRVDPRVFFDETAPPDPFVTEHTRDMRHQPAYHIDAITAEGDARLEVTKSWGEGDHQRLVIPQSDWLTARENAEVAHDLMERGDLQGAMILVEIAGIEAGVIDPKRDDPRLFTDGPPDPFTTIRERDLASPEMDTQTLPAYPTLYADWAEQVQQEREANAHLEGTAWFEATFKKGERDLLQPLDDTVNYGVVVQAVDPWTSELAVEKYWKEPNGHLGSDSQTIQTFASEDDVQREAAEAAREGLLDVYDARGLEAMMHQAELLAMDSGQLDGERLDPRLFTNGPPDRFETLAQQLEVEPNPYWNTDREQIEARSGQDVENPYWRLETLPVNDLDGQPLGHALHMVVYPGIPQEADAVGSPAISPDEPFRLLEMAHFETTEAADMFGKEFNSYLIPDVLDGPELAVEVARLEGLPAEWKTLEGDELKAYQNADLTLIREPADWHLYNPNAERDARIAAEGLYTDPMVSSVDLNRTDDSASTEPAPFELDL